MTSVAKPSLHRITKALAVAGAFVAYGCGTGNSPTPGLEQYVIQGEAQGTTYTIKYLATDSVPHAVVTEVLRAVAREPFAVWAAQATAARLLLHMRL
mgnify:CR=1 FL=1